jgi:translation initiation factor IF-2
VTNNNDKKTLGLKSGTLGLSRSATGKLAMPTGQVKQTAQTSSKGKVVVVTKSRHGSGAKTAVDHGLTNAEKESRLHAIKFAELNKRKIEEEKRELQAKQEEALQNVAQPQVTESVENAPQEVVEQPRKEVVAPVKEIKRISLDEIINKQKIRNLDSLHRPVKVVEEPAAEAEEQKAAKGEAAKDFSQKPGIKPAVKKAGDEEEVVVPKKVADVKGKEPNRKISVAQVMMMDSDESGAGFKRRSLASIKRAREKAKRKIFGGQKPQEKLTREVNIPDFITVQELSNRMAEKTADVIKAIMKLGMLVTVNQAIDADTAEIIVNEFGHKVKRVTEAEIESNLLQTIDDKEASLLPRPPVVTIMGHVDHGKTSLLDALRQTDVAAGEAGGITQHIGAYQITLPTGQLITFLDTPGHEAFTAMRMRGAKVTDIVVLVVAADDGIMQQTVEAISHAKAAKVPIIVAINKIDKPEADPQRVKNELFSHNLIPDDMGGDVMVVEVSAKQKINLDKLEEAILLQAEMLELKANPNRLAQGAVVEAKMEKGRGTVATILVQKGTIRAGDIIVAGSTWGKIRALINDKGVNIESAPPSMPIEILGLTEAPVAGDDFVVVANEKTAKDLVTFRMQRDRQKRLVAGKAVSLEQLFKKAQATGAKELPIIIKADVQGSVEAIVNSLQKLSDEEIIARILHSAVGGITESDVTLATASNAVIVGFNVRANQHARELARLNGIEIKYYSIIYNLVDDIKAAMSGMLSPIVKENLLGYVEIRDVFDLSKYGKVAGCYVTEGLIKRGSNVRIIRDSVVIFDGKLKALKRFKDDVKEVTHGFECGLSFENYEDIKAGDKIEVYERTEHQRSL